MILCTLKPYELDTLYVYWVQAGVALLGLAFAIVAYRKYLAQRLAESQLRLVVKLIKALHKEKAKFILQRPFVPGKPGRTEMYIVYRNYFELAAIHPIKEKHYDSVPFVTTSEHNIIKNNKIRSYTVHPLMPRKIANAMRNLQFNFAPTYLSSFLASNYIMVGEKQSSSISPLIQPQLYISEKSFSAYAASCHAVTSAIINWLKNNGLDDLNQNVLQPETKSLFHEPDLLA